MPPPKSGLMEKPGLSEKPGLLETSGPPPEADPPATSGPAPQPGAVVPGPSDFEAIESAVMETARGRWFLAEYAQRHRQSDTDAVLDAIARLEQGVAAERREREERRMGPPSVAALAEAVARGRAEIAALGETNEAATERLAGVAERLQELAWNLRETGSDEDACAVIDASAADIYAAGTEATRLLRRARLASGVLDMLDERLGGTPAGLADEPRDEGHQVAAETLPVPEAPPAFGVAWVDEDVAEPAGEVEILAPQPSRPLRLPTIPTLAWRAPPEEADAPRQAPEARPLPLRRGPVTLAEIEALPFEEKVALFS